MEKCVLSIQMDGKRCHPSRMAGYRSVFQEILGEHVCIKIGNGDSRSWIDRKFCVAPMTICWGCLRGRGGPWNHPPLRARQTHVEFVEETRP